MTAIDFDAALLAREQIGALAAASHPRCGRSSALARCNCGSATSASCHGGFFPTTASWCGGAATVAWLLWDLVLSTQRRFVLNLWASAEPPAVWFGFSPLMMSVTTFGSRESAQLRGGIWVSENEIMCQRDVDKGDNRLLVRKNDVTGDEVIFDRSPLGCKGMKLTWINSKWLVVCNSGQCPSEKDYPDDDIPQREPALLMVCKIPGSTTPSGSCASSPQIGTVVPIPADMPVSSLSGPLLDVFTILFCSNKRVLAMAVDVESTFHSARLCTVCTASGCLDDSCVHTNHVNSVLLLRKESGSHVFIIGTSNKVFSLEERSTTPKVLTTAKGYSFPVITYVRGTHFLISSHFKGNRSWEVWDANNTEGGPLQVFDLCHMTPMSPVLSVMTAVGMVAWVADEHHLSVSETKKKKAQGNLLSPVDPDELPHIEFPERFVERLLISRPRVSLFLQMDGPQTGCYASSVSAPRKRTTGGAPAPLHRARRARATPSSSPSSTAPPPCPSAGIGSDIPLPQPPPSPCCPAADCGADPGAWAAAKRGGAVRVRVRVVLGAQVPDAPDVQSTTTTGSASSSGHEGCGGVCCVWCGCASPLACGSGSGSNTACRCNCTGGEDRVRATASRVESMDTLARANQSRGTLWGVLRLTVQRRGSYHGGMTKLQQYTPFPQVPIDFQPKLSLLNKAVRRSPQVTVPRSPPSSPSMDRTVLLEQENMKKLLQEQAKTGIQAACNPDFVTPFANVTDAISRLLPYTYLMCPTPPPEPPNSKQFEGLIDKLADFEGALDASQCEEKELSCLAYHFFFDEIMAKKRLCAKRAQFSQSQPSTTPPSPPSSTPSSSQME
ncbi:hypothetical protein Pelo_17919 [Pelomyxa schiedti]|nr:hypothetical protein Pelo_17919 [Pelomyxa schiedti]